MFTKEQEDYLRDLADKALAEQAETEERNKQILIDLEVNVARDAKRAELEAQAEQLIADGLIDFDTNVAPTIKPEVVAQKVE